MPEYVWIIPGYVWLCVNVPKFVWMACFTFTHCNRLSKGTIDCFLGKWKFDFFYSSWKYLTLFFVFRLNTFTSKASNFLLPLRVERASGFESYATSEITNKYIYFFLMIYLFCSFVSLLKKSQDNASKRATVEKEPLTLENDKEEQSKYYLSYPKSLVLDMK